MDEYHLLFGPTFTSSLTHYDNGWMLILADNEKTAAIYLTEEQVQELGAVIHGRME